MAGEPPKALAAKLRAFRKEISEKAPKVATRKSSEMVLEVINAVMPETIGGSADLTGSNNTLTKDLGVFDPRTARAATSTTASANTGWPRR
jgi:transketolase